MVYSSEEMVRLCNKRYREVDTGEEKFRYVLENTSGRPSSSISEHAATLQYSISNHYYNLVGDVVKIYDMIRNFEVVNRRNMKTKKELVQHKNKLTEVLQQYLLYSVYCR